jgi:hypothetical protein
MRRRSSSPARPRPDPEATRLDARLLRLPCVQLLLSQLVLILAFPFLQRVALGLALAVVAAQVAYFGSGIGHLGAVALLALCAFQAYAIWCLLRYVMQDEVATTDELFAAASMYVLLAMAFACLFSVLEHAAPGSFFINPTNNVDGAVNWWDLVYFSFTTLTSVGFGEITPVTSHARSLVMVEQVVGVLFVALLVARLTGIYRSRAR